MTDTFALPTARRFVVAGAMAVALSVARPEWAASNWAASNWG